jgi:hypothetical protein
MFVHLAPESTAKLIRRNGISRLRRPFANVPSGIFATPVTRNFFASHQWLRELKRRSKGPIVGIYFRIPDDEFIWIGHYGQAHQLLRAAAAVATFARSHDPMGWEVIIPRRIEAGEIHRVRTLPQVIGWRYSPNAKGKRPCACDFCTRGQYGGARLRMRLGTK